MISLVDVNDDARHLAVAGGGGFVAADRDGFAAVQIVQIEGHRAIGAVRRVGAIEIRIIRGLIAGDLADQVDVVGAFDQVEIGPDQRRIFTVAVQRDQLQRFKAGDFGVGNLDHVHNAHAAREREIFQRLITGDGDNAFAGGSTEQRIKRKIIIELVGNALRHLGREAFRPLDEVAFLDSVADLEPLIATLEGDRDHLTQREQLFAIVNGDDLVIRAGNQIVQRLGRTNGERVVAAFTIDEAAGAHQDVG